MTEPTNGTLKITLEWTPDSRQAPGLAVSCSAIISEPELSLDKCPALRWTITRMLEGIGRVSPEINIIIKKEGWKYD